MKLLFDANLSPRLVKRLEGLFPQSIHVFEAGLERFASDLKIWEYAKANGFAIVTADSDFLRIADERGAPPHIVRLENCNYRTAKVEAQLRLHAIRIADLETTLKAVLVIRGA